ncbi:MAG TPA: Hsp20/alpha crystallin family protein [Acidobacteriota bacterium]|nr:Hsp20/alpha crystallin family protein [Acidobacteriota bacterium]
MTLMRLRPRPMVDFENLQRTMNRMFEEVFSDFSDANGIWQGSWRPAADIYETESDIHLDVELPGFQRDEIEISLDNGALTISGERKMEEEKDRNYHRTERAYGRFQRTFQLPTTADDENVKAELKNGVLAITIPKRPEARRKHIPVTVS